MIKVGQMRKMIEGCPDDEIIYVAPKGGTTFMTPIGHGPAATTMLITGQIYETAIVPVYREAPEYPETKGDSIETRAERLADRNYTHRIDEFEFIVSKVTRTKIPV